ncbi:MAG: hypothetical protein JXR37_06000 [Kiritimatiellae bacterium]|nr:hypothetical protein [Kiritimatiellia bacterium]
MRRLPRFGLALLATLLLSGVALAQTSEVARTHDGCGGWSTNATCQTVIAACQPCPVGFLEHTNDFLAYSGFLHSFLMHTNLDTDADGLVDENDPDNDGDGLDDDEELSGARFSPVTATSPQEADTDGDGLSDGAEAAAGTHPGDAEQCLEISDFQYSGGEVVLTWVSREGYQYEIVCATSVVDLATATQVVATITAGTGTGAWQIAESVCTNSAGETARFYRVDLK